ncbi:IclR family transcriptional regulator [Microvirga rosea]|uniref:IclR family transcriptional regulator n=1 Tax=Microvirga rosea TaxID=2715425 RepID=UPI001D0B420C|nr:IclR family transcriptional regulator [Microvirga rosea]MCB8823221.1 IclR family transcriptional regulator [Microvirga rosea]
MSVRPLSSVLKAFAALDIIASSTEPLRLADVARMLGEARATTLQRLVTLVEAGWIEQSDDGRYRLTLKVVHHATIAMEQAGIGTRLLDVLHEVVAESGETASLAVLEGTESVIINRVESRGLLRADLRIGTRLPLSDSATGRVLVAHASSDTINRLECAGIELGEPAVLSEVRERGFAVSGPLGPRTVTAVAAPVFGVHGECIAALSISGPTNGFDMDLSSKIVTQAASKATARIRGANE